MRLLRERRAIAGILFPAAPPVCGAGRHPLSADRRLPGGHPTTGKLTIAGRRISAVFYEAFAG
jgi:hypothetical protein